MSRTYKDRPYRLGGKQHRYICCNCHGAHGKFTRLMRRLRRRAEMRELRMNGDVPPKTYHRYMYFD